MTDARQVGAAVAEKAGQQRRAKTLKRKLEQAMSRVGLGDQSAWINVGPYPSPPRPRSKIIAISDKGDCLSRLGAKSRDQVTPAVDAPSRGADSPSHQRFRGVVGQANGDIGVAPGQIERLI